MTPEALQIRHRISIPTGSGFRIILVTCGAPFGSKAPSAPLHRLMSSSTVRHVPATQTLARLVLKPSMRGRTSCHLSSPAGGDVVKDKHCAMLRNRLCVRPYFDQLSDGRKLYFGERQPGQCSATGRPLTANETMYPKNVKISHANGGAPILSPFHAAAVAVTAAPISDIGKRHRKKSNEVKRAALFNDNLVFTDE